MHRSLERLDPELRAVVRAMGGFFDPDDAHDEATNRMFGPLTARLDRCVEYAESHLYDDRDRNLAYGLVCDWNLNAFACASSSRGSPGLDLIGISVGVIPTLIHVFGRILSHPGSFPDVGDSSLEDSSAGLLPRLTTDFVRSGQSLSSPKCPVRSAFAGELVQTALVYLFFHEMTHLRHGHIEYAREHLRATHWAEVGELDHGRTDALVRQTLEMDADSGALLHTLNQAFVLTRMFAANTNEVDPLVLGVMRAAYRDVKTATRTVVYAAYVMFRLFDVNDWDCDQQLAQTHPQFPIRMSWIGPTLHAIFSRYTEHAYEPAESVSDTVKVMFEAEADCGRIRGREPDPSGIMSVYSTSASRDYLGTLERTWCSIRPDLDLHKRGGRLPD